MTHLLKQKICRNRVFECVYIVMTRQYYGKVKSTLILENFGCSKYIFSIHACLSTNYVKVINTFMARIL